MGGHQAGGGRGESAQGMGGACARPNRFQAAAQQGPSGPGRLDAQALPRAKKGFAAAPVLIGIALSAAALWACLGVGMGTWADPSQVDPLLMQIRKPRVFVALIVGLSLAVSGAALQAVFENPLADPSLIGTSGGAALGVVASISFGWGGVSIPMAAFLGAMAVCALILGVHKLFGGGMFGLLILGFVISAFTGALTSLIMFLSDDLALRAALNWLSGSLVEAGFISPAYAVGSMALGLAILLPLGRSLDALMLGEETASSMGVSLYKTRALAVAGASFLTAAAVSLAGVIGFVGMMAPNLASIVWGGPRLKIMLLSAWVGGIILPVVDALARWAAYPIDLPVGLVVALLGAPFFVYLFARGFRLSRG